MVDPWDEDPTFVDGIEGYCHQPSYCPGDTVELAVSTHAASYSVTIERWGPERHTVHTGDQHPGRYFATPDDADASGCDWPVTVRIPVADEWRSGFYLVTLIGDGLDPGRDRAHAWFVLRPSPAVPGQGRNAPSLLVLATNTWNAYNTWGGKSLYTGGTQVSFNRPMARGALDREPTDRDDRKARPTRWGETPDVEGETFQRYRLARRYPPIIGSSGWYLYERRFVEWAEAEGYEFDYATSADLERDPGLVAGYDRIVSIGHDEYWSAGQRDAVEGFVAAGGNLVTLSGNTMFWQVRIETVAERGTTMVCHKYRAHLDDPILADDPTRMTGMWADPLVGRPEAGLLGGGSAWGLYNRFGQAVRRGSGAFTVYRHDHWLLAGTDLGYGDLLGAAHGCVGYETLGCRLQFDEFQLPVRAGGDGTPRDMEVIAFTPSSNCGVGEYPKSISALNDQGDLEFIAERIHGDLSERSLALARYGNAILAVSRPFGDTGGEVIAAGTTDWVFGLPDDSAIAQVTRNALDRRPTADV